MEPKPPQQEVARTLYFMTDKTQEEIATMVGVNRRTVWLWSKKGNWREIKLAARNAPAAIAENLYTQLVSLTGYIKEREQNYPTLPEAETIRKMVMSLNQLNHRLTLGENIQMLANFISHISKTDLKLSQEIASAADKYLLAKTTITGDHPTHIDYDTAEHLFTEVEEEENTTFTFDETEYPMR